MKLFAVLMGLLVAGEVSAKRYFTQEEAAKALFPNGDSWVKKVELLSLKERSMIQKACGLPATLRGHHVWVVRRKKALIGVAIIDFVPGKHENIDYAVGITIAGRVKQIEIMEYRESYGFEIRRDRWREQFAGKTKLDALRLHKDIDNIGGATISCRNVTDGVKRVLATFELVLKGRVANY